MKTIYYARDRKGEHWFSSRPSFIAMHDILSGSEVAKPKGKKFRIVKNFKCLVTGHPVAMAMYPKTIRFSSNT